MSLLSTPIAEHEIALFSRVDGFAANDGNEPIFGIFCTAGGTTHSAKIFPTDQYDALGGRYSDQAIWERSTDKSASDPTIPKIGLPRTEDFFNHLKNALEGRGEIKTISIWKLSDLALRLLNRADLSESQDGSSKRGPRRMFLQLNNSAKSRIQSAGVSLAPLSIKVNEGKLIKFEYGVCFAVYRLSFARLDQRPISGVELMEINSALGRFNNVSWEPLKSPVQLEASDEQHTLSGKSEISLGQVLRAVALGPNQRTRLAGRVNSFSFARFDQSVPADEKKSFARKLARKNTTDYHLIPDTGADQTLHEFEELTHTIAVEGASTVIAPVAEGPVPEFLVNFRSDAWQRNYLPIALLSLHTKALLIALKAAAASTASGSASVEDRLTRQASAVEILLAHRLKMRSVQISQISMHNSVFEAFEEVHKLSSLESELTKDLEKRREALKVEAERIAAGRQKGRDKIFHVSATIGAGALAGLTGYTIFKELVPLVCKTENLSVIQFTEMCATKNSKQWTAFFLGGVVLLTTSLVVWFQGPKSHDNHAGHLPKEFMSEFMKKFLLKD